MPLPPRKPTDDLEDKPQIIGGSSAIIPNAPTSNTANKGGSSFSNISEYLQQNAPQSAALAGQVGNVVTGQNKAAETAINTAESAFNTNVGKGTVTYDENLANRAASNTSEVAGNTEENARFKQMFNAEYKGPRSIEEETTFNPAMQSATKAKQTAANLETETGRKELLGGIQGQGKRQANAGVSSLNNLLLQNAPGAKETFAGVKSGLSDLDARLKAASESSLSKAAAAKAATDLTKSTTRSKMDETVANFNTGLDTKTANTIANYGSAEQLDTGDITDAQLQAMGLNRDLYNSIRADQYVGSNLGQYQPSKVSGGMINKNTVATAEDYAKQAALNELMGTSAAYINTPELAGTGNLSSNQFDIESLKRNAIESATRPVTAANSSLQQAIAANKAIWRPAGWTDQPGTKGYIAAQAQAAAQAELARQQAIYNANVARYNEWK